MRKLTTAFALLFGIMVFGQNTGKKGTYGMAGGTKGNRQETPKQINHADRAFTNSCYKGFAFTLKNYGYNKDGKFYSWGIKVKNNYKEAVQLKYKLIVGNDNPKNGTLTYYIKPGETYTNDFGTAQAIIVGNNSDKYKIEVTEVCFEGQDCMRKGYVECGGIGKSPNKSNKIISNSSESNSTSNIIPISNLFDRSIESTEQHAQKIIDNLTNAGFHFIGHPANTGEYQFAENFYFSFMLDMNNTWPEGFMTNFYISNQSGKTIEKLNLEILIKLFCTNNNNYTCKSGSSYINIEMNK